MPPRAAKKPHPQKGSGRAFAPTTKTGSLDYLEWNDRIAVYFFRPEMVGRKVFLYVTAELIEELGNPRQAHLADFIGAVLTGPPWPTRAGLCYRAYDTFTNWRQRNLPYPPY